MGQCQARVHNASWNPKAFLITQRFSPDRLLVADRGTQPLQHLVRTSDSAVLAVASYFSLTCLGACWHIRPSPQVVFCRPRVTGPILAMFERRSFVRFVKTTHPWRNDNISCTSPRQAGFG